jgi:hypothetical protein
VRELLGADQGHAVARYALWGALLGIATFAPFGVAASMCECTLLHYNPGFGVGILIAFVAIGMGFGAFEGCFVGVGEAERGTHLYCQGVRLGAKVTVVQAKDRGKMDTIEAVAMLGLLILFFIVRMCALSAFSKMQAQNATPEKARRFWEGDG